MVARWKQPIGIGAIFLGLLAAEAYAAPKETPGGGPSKVPIVLHDADVVSSRVFVRGKTTSLEASIYGATGLHERTPVKSGVVSVSLVAKPAGKEPTENKRAGSKRAAKKPAGNEPAAKRARFDVEPVKTGANGRAAVAVTVPRSLAAGSYELVVHTKSMHGENTYKRSVEIVDATRLHLRTDRGVYRPGQVVRWRVTATSAIDTHPEPIELDMSIADPKGTLVWRGQAKVGRAGMVAGELPLGDDLVLGSYTLKARGGGVATSETVQVKDYRVAPFTVAIVRDSLKPLRPGATVRGWVKARYAHGEPVSGRIAFRAAGARTSGILDSHGRYRFEFRAPLSAGTPSMVARVTDGAGQSHEARQPVPMHVDQLKLAVVDGGVDEKGRHRVIAITTDGTGNFIPAKVSMKSRRGSGRQLRTSDGVAEFTVPLTADQSHSHRYRTFQVNAFAADGRGSNRTLRVYKPSRARASRAVVAAGGEVVVRGTFETPKGLAVAILYRNDDALVTERISVDDKGRFVARLRAPAGVSGLTSVVVSQMAWVPRTGKDRTEHHAVNVFIRPAKLAVSIDVGTRYRPGETAKLNVSITDGVGRAAPGVALAAAVTDERVLALSKPLPDLVTVLHDLDASKAQSLGLVFAKLVRANDSRSLRAADAVVRSLPAPKIRPSVVLVAAARLRVEYARLVRAKQAVRGIMNKSVPSLGARDSRGAWSYREPLAALLIGAKWKTADIHTPWAVPVSWPYQGELLPKWTFNTMATEVTDGRLRSLARRLLNLRMESRLRQTPALLARLIRRKRVSARLSVDAWGSRFRVEVGTGVVVVSSGPDLRFGTSDDRRQSLDASSLGGGYGYGLAGHGSGGGSAMGYGGMGRIGRAEAHVIRKRFDETVLWVAGATTDAHGHARFDVPLADSITGWKVMVEALGPKGAVGHATARIETALPVYVDADVPRVLTVGDRYGVRAVVANHSGSTRTLLVQLQATGSVSTSVTDKRVKLPSGTTTAVEFDVAAPRIGKGTIKLAVRDDGRVIDAMERSIQVEPVGAKQRRIVTAKLTRGRAAVTVNVPKGALEMSANVRMFRGAMDQAVDGLDGMLREPHGCFEQTSSATFPNLLVLRLAKDNPKFGSVRDRARKLVAKGYQRLISYEVSGGGFSWFGEAPAHPVLTAYGLVEFTDMAKVYPVDPKLVVRTRKWLLKGQRRNGSWKANRNGLDAVGTVKSELESTAYIAWALAESGYRGRALRRAANYLARHQRALSKRAELLAMWAVVARASGRSPARAMARLARRSKRTAQGGLHVDSGGTGMFYATGASADVQATALAAVALARSHRSADAQAALSWLWSARKPSYGWGTTQATVLALRAAAEIAPTAIAKGKVDVIVDGRRVARVDLDSSGVPTANLSSYLSPGSHKIELRGSDVGVINADIRWQWRTATAPSPVENGLKVALVAAKTVSVGQSTTATVTVTNPGNSSVDMPTVVVPVPPGFRGNRAGLKKLERRSDIAKVEDRGSEIFIYATTLAPGQSMAVVVPLDVTAVVSATQRPVRAYAYYTPTLVGSSASPRVSSRPRVLVTDQKHRESFRRGKTGSSPWVTLSWQPAAP